MQLGDALQKAVQTANIRTQLISVNNLNKQCFTQVYDYISHLTPENVFTFFLSILLS